LAKICHNLLRRNYARTRKKYTRLLGYSQPTQSINYCHTYKSSATILIKEQDIPNELVRSTVTSFAAQRIQTISQSVMTRPNLMAIIEKYDLYVKERRKKTLEEVLQNMQDDISVDMVTADVVDPRTGRLGVATIAFTLSYEGASSASTQKVTGELKTRR